MSQSRTSCLESMRAFNPDLVLITEANLKEWIPNVHPAFKFLTPVHKSDYVRTALMYFHGGAWSDVKRHHESWCPYIDALYGSDYWMAGATERNACDTPVIALQPHYQSLVSLGGFAVKSGTPLVRVWYNDLINKMNAKASELQAHPGQHPRDHAELGQGYPLRWAELLGELFHPAQFSYKEKVLHSFPYPDCSNYL